jgi:hypothetical protein
LLVFWVYYCLFVFSCGVVADGRGP